MTLHELLQLIGENPSYVLFYFCIIPFAALLAGILGKGEGDIAPWKYLYSTLIYLICVPGIFAVTLSVYVFLFEKRSIFETDIFMQILPVLSMIVTLLIIRKNVDLDRIPGFDKLSGLVTIILAALIIMWFIDRTHIWVISYLPIGYLLLIFVVLLVVIRFGWGKLMSGTKD
ncbi:MAG: hypothetical protein DHS20C18_23780 [Saprospiraceae bacterium]|nr:MAG: hypothetical protein DHS20C18_23780 [Saprospiraceae bacterium]